MNGFCLRSYDTYDFIEYTCVLLRVSHWYGLLLWNITWYWNLKKNIIYINSHKFSKQKTFFSLDNHAVRGTHAQIYLQTHEIYWFVFKVNVYFALHFASFSVALNLWVFWMHLHLLKRGQKLSWCDNCILQYCKTGSVDFNYFSFERFFQWAWSNEHWLSFSFPEQ